jgi:hypothetical protein
VVSRTRRREEEALCLAEGALPALGGPQHTPQPLHDAAPIGGSAARGKGEGGARGGGAGAGHRVLSTDPRTNRVMVESYVRLSRRAGHGEDELMEQEGAAPEEGEAPPSPREVEYVRVQSGPATRWVDSKGGAAGAAGAAGGGTAKYVAPLPGP